MAESWKGLKKVTENRKNQKSSAENRKTHIFVAENRKETPYYPPSFAFLARSQAIVITNMNIIMNNSNDYPQCSFLENLKFEV